MKEFHPHLETLPAAQARLWHELSALPEQFVLYGGTALTKTPLNTTSSLSERKSPLNRSRILPDIKTSGEPDDGDLTAAPGGSLLADSVFESVVMSQEQNHAEFTIRRNPRSGQAQT
jgi:hypothetical protein